LVAAREGAILVESSWQDRWAVSSDPLKWQAFHLVRRCLRASAAGNASQMSEAMGDDQLQCGKRSDLMRFAKLGRERVPNNRLAGIGDRARCLYVPAKEVMIQVRMRNSALVVPDIDLGHLES
jgi:hypothetical protein